MRRGLGFPSIPKISCLLGAKRQILFLASLFQILIEFLVSLRFEEGGVWKPFFLKKGAGISRYWGVHLRCRGFIFPGGGGGVVVGGVDVISGREVWDGSFISLPGFASPLNVFSSFISGTASSSGSPPISFLSHSYQ